MEVNKFAKQMIEFQKATFNNTFSTISMLQDQSEKMINTFLEQNPMLPKQNKDAFNEWLKVCKKARDDYKKTIDESFKNLESYFTESAKS
jgi:polyhydroxyalkanoate synthesis regulator phasin